MVQISLSAAYLVYTIALHLGLTIGWHSGQALTKRSFSQLLNQYYIGIAIILVTVAILFSDTNWTLIAICIALGFGIGFAYDDKENHPPEGMTTYIFQKFITLFNEIKSIKEEQNGK